MSDEEAVNGNSNGNETMLFEAALFQFLTESASIGTLIGDNIYPGALPQPPKFPAITYSLISRVPTRDLSGVIFQQSRFQFTCWSTSYDEAKTLAGVLRSALDDYTGNIGMFRVLDSLAENETDLVEPETGLHYVPVDILIRHK